MIPNLEKALRRTLAVWITGSMIFCPLPIAKENANPDQRVAQRTEENRKHAESENRQDTRLRPSQREKAYHPMIMDVSRRHGVDAALVMAVIKAESGYDPIAVSEKGAVGLMQLMPTTADALEVEDLFNPEYNIQGGVRYLKQLLIKFKGNSRLAVAAYNAGMTAVKRYKGVPPYKATRYYVQKVFEYYPLYQEQVVGRDV
jgi:soluble lytic murein transglycosylase-like protein